MKIFIAVARGYVVTRAKKIGEIGGHRHIVDHHRFGTNIKLVPGKSPIAQHADPRKKRHQHFRPVKVCINSPATPAFLNKLPKPGSLQYARACLYFY